MIMVAIFVSTLGPGWIERNIKEGTGDGDVEEAGSGSGGVGRTLKLKRLTCTYM
jgi:hypothetical protein